MAYQRYVLPVCVFTLTVATSVLCSPARTEREVSYEGFQVLRLQSEDPDSLKVALHALDHAANVDVWSRARRSIDVMVAPDRLRHARETAEEHGIASNVVIDDVQRYLEEDFAHRRQREKRATRDVTNSYLTLAEIMSYLQNLEGQATTADVTVTSIGKSYENRDVPLVELREKRSSGRKKHAILIDAGIHAREWIAPAMALNIIHKLAFNPDSDPEVTDLLEKFDWFIVPSVNPDGYFFSHSSPSARLWRKTRTNEYSSRCLGVDANRNFGYDWNPAIGGSRNPCLETYSGRTAFSEPETRNVRDWMLRNKDTAVAYITIHSFGEWLLYPFGSDKNKPLPDKQLMVEVANVFKAKLAESNHYYAVGNSADLLYPAAGGSDDYAKGGANIPVSYTLEMSPKEWRNGGFRLPEGLISQTIRDTWPGFKAMAQRLFREFGYADNNGGGESTATGGNGSSSGGGGGGGGQQGAWEVGSNGLVPINWYGHTLYVDPTNPVVRQFLQYYYRMRNAGNSGK